MGGEYGGKGWGWSGDHGGRGTWTWYSNNLFGDGPPFATKPQIWLIPPKPPPPLPSPVYRS